MGPGRAISIGDTELYVVERGNGYPILVLHGGPGLDHHAFGDYLDPLCDEFRLVLVDQRGQGRSGPAPAETWTLGHMAADIDVLAEAMGLGSWAVLGHSYGAFVALQNAVDFPGRRVQTIVSSGIPSSRWLGYVEVNLEAFEPVRLREQVTQSWAKEAGVTTPEEVGALLEEQIPFHFADPLDPRIDDFNARTSGAVYSPEILRHFAASDYGGIEVEERLTEITHPVLVLAGRHDRTCSVEAAETMAAEIPGAELVVFEDSAHMTFVEENERYIEVVRSWLGRHT